MNKIEEKIIKSIFDDMKNGIFPKFGSPETKCDKCMFCGVICQTNHDYVGCLGGWKREED